MVKNGGGFDKCTVFQMGGRRMAFAAQNSPQQPGENPDRKHMMAERDRTYPN